MKPAAMTAMKPHVQALHPHYNQGMQLDRLKTEAELRVALDRLHRARLTGSSKQEMKTALLGRLIALMMHNRNGDLHYQS